MSKYCFSSPRHHAISMMPSPLILSRIFLLVPEDSFSDGLIDCNEDDYLNMLKFLYSTKGLEYFELDDYVFAFLEYSRWDPITPDLEARGFKHDERLNSCLDSWIEEKIRQEELEFSYLHKEKKIIKREGL